MGHLSNEEIQEIVIRLATYGKKDTQFPDAGELSADDIVAIVQNYVNKKTTLGALNEQMTGDIREKIPEEASSSNKLADKAWVTSELSDYVPASGGTFTGNVEIEGNFQTNHITEYAGSDHISINARIDMDGYGIDMDGNTIQKVGTPVNNTDAANKAYVDLHHDSTKQDALVSGSNIKTINGATLLGSGNIDIDSIYAVNDGTTYAQLREAINKGLFPVRYVNDYGDWYPLVFDGGTEGEPFVFAGLDEIGNSIRVMRFIWDDNLEYVWESFSIPLTSSVRFDTSQSLTDAQKAQARTNIGAIDSATKDYAQNDPTNGEYIKNRPGGFDPPLSWTDALVVGSFSDAGEGYFIVSDIDLPSADKNTLLALLDAGVEIPVKVDYEGSDEASSVLKYSASDDFYIIPNPNPGELFSFNELFIDYSGIPGFYEDDMNYYVAVQFPSKYIPHDSTKQDTLTFDNAPTQNSNNPVKSGGVYSGLKAITDLVPAQASSSNQLADKNFVNSSIQTNTATFRGTYYDLKAFVEYSTLEYGNPDNNDYAVVRNVETSAWDADNVYQADEVCLYDDGVSSTKIFLCIKDMVSTPRSITPDQDTEYWKEWMNIEQLLVYHGPFVGTWRFKYVPNGAFDITNWQPEYQVNEKPLTAAQLAALNSGITDTKVAKLDALPATIPTEVFWATKGTTTAAEIDAAVTAGKIVMCAYDGKEYRLSNTASGLPIIFSCDLGATLWRLTLDRTTGNWSNAVAFYYEQTANKKSSWSSTPNNTNYPGEKLVKDSIDAVDKVFVAVNPTTTNTDIIAASNAGKIVVCFYDGKIFRLTRISGTDCVFTASIGNITYRITRYTNSWGSLTFTLEETSNKVSTISGNETSTSKYPNTKAVYDFVTGRTWKATVTPSSTNVYLVITLNNAKGCVLSLDSVGDNSIHGIICISDVMDITSAVFVGDGVIDTSEDVEIGTDANGNAIVQIKCNGDVFPVAITCLGGTAPASAEVYSSSQIDTATATQPWTELGVDSSDVFWATYGTTTAADIEAASAAGKAVYCLYNSKQYTLAFIDSTYIYFSTSRMERYYNLVVHRTTNVWQVLTATYELSANKKSAWSNTPSDSNYPSEKLTYDSIQAVDKVFWATYGTTTFNEVVAANTAGKIVMMSYSNEFGILTKITASLAYFFHYQNGRRIKLYTLQSNDSWGVSENFVPENEANKKTDIPANRTSETYYPNTKGVFDLTSKWGVISQTQTWTHNADGGWSYTMEDLVNGVIPQANIDLFVAAGATFNSVSGYFELNGLTDISYEEMQAIYNTFTGDLYRRMAMKFVGLNVRTNLVPNWFGRVRAVDGCEDRSFTNGLGYSKLEVVVLPPVYGTAMFETGSIASLMHQALYLRKVINPMKYTGTAAPTVNAFPVYSLEDIELHSIKWSFAIASPRLSKASLLYMINNEASTGSITITLNATVYAKCQSGGEWYSDVSTALSSHPNISLASA